MESICLQDWMTTKEVPLGTKVTEAFDDVYHSHNFFEFFYIIDGSIKHVLGTKKETLQCGDGYFLSAEIDSHIFLREPNETSGKHRDIVIRSEAFKRACDYISADFFENFTKGKINKKVHLAGSEIAEIERKLALIFRISNKMELKTELIDCFVIYLLNLLIEHNNGDEEASETSEPAWLKELLSRFNMVEFVKEGLPKILEPFFFNRAYLCRTFKKYTGMTMTDYLNKIRLDHAVSMLQFTGNSVANIAYSLGFSSVSYFNHIFKERFGISPNKFRNGAK